MDICTFFDSLKIFVRLYNIFEVETDRLVEVFDDCNVCTYEYKLSKQIENAAFVVFLGMF